MALSDYEKEVLAQMERGLKEEDPQLAHTLTSSLPVDDSEPTRLSPRRIALGSIVAVVGLAVVVGGVSAQILWLSITLGTIGFVLMVGGVLWALKGDRDTAPRKQPRSGSDSSSFMDRQRDRWENRDRN